MPNKPPDHQDRIIQDPNILVGKPVVKGTRIPVKFVLGKLAENPDLEDLFAAYHRLTTEDVKACLTFARTVVEKKRSRRAAQPHRAGPPPAA